jgi:hypothetical protein
MNRRFEVRWIPVTDQLPDFGVPVWLHEAGIMYVGERSEDADGWLWAKCYDSHYYDKTEGRWKSFSADIDDAYEPTHWMPLPEPPSLPAAGKAVTDSCEVTEAKHG